MWFRITSGACVGTARSSNIVNLLAIKTFSLKYKNKDVFTLDALDSNSFTMIYSAAILHKKRILHSMRIFDGTITTTLNRFYSL